MSASEKGTGPGESGKLSPQLSIVVPVYNEQEILPAFHGRLTGVLSTIALRSEIIYVNDGSTDASLAFLMRLREDDPRIAVLDLSRNFGKEIALSAGLDHAAGNAVVVIDADLQDPPELIPELLEGLREGYDMVFGKRMGRRGEPLLKRVTASLFYRLMRRLGTVAIPEDTGDFRALSRRAVEALKELEEQHRFMKGLFAWIGYPQKAVPYERLPRPAGRTKWNYWKLWNFALEGITSFSSAPLRVSTYMGLATALGAFFYALYVILKTLLFGDPVKGYPSLMVVMLFLGGIQLMSLGIIGEYLGRMYIETKRRPLYFLNAHHPTRSLPGGGPLVRVQKDLGPAE